MGIGAGLAGAEFTFFSHLGATGWTPHSQCLFFGDFHVSIMLVYRVGRMVNFDHCGEGRGVPPLRVRSGFDEKAEDR
jgi:hypothetical protein